MKGATGVIAVLLTAVAPGAHGDTGGAPPAETLRVGLDPRSLPSVYVPGLDYTKEDQRKPPRVTSAQLLRLEGFEVEVLGALGRLLKARPVVVPTSWFDLESGLLAKRFDAILSSWTPSETTSRVIQASDAYWDWGLLVAVRAPDARVHTLADLAGRRVGYFADPAVTEAIRTMGSSLDAELVAAEDSSVLFKQLQAGTIDALLFDSPYVRWRVSKSQAFRIVGEPLNRLGYHVGVRREDGALLSRVNAAIKGLRDSGELERIRLKWEGRR